MCLLPPLPTSNVRVYIPRLDLNALGRMDQQDVAKQLRDQQMVMKGHRDDALVHVRRLV